MSETSSVVVVAGLITKDIEAFKNLVLPVAKLSLTESGCLRYDVLQDVQNPNAFFFIEEYVDNNAFEAHRQMPYMTPFREQRAKLVDKYLGVDELRRLNSR